MTEALLAFGVGAVASLVGGSVVVLPMLIREWRATRLLPTAEDILWEVAQIRAIETHLACFRYPESEFLRAMAQRADRQLTETEADRRR